MPPESVSTQKEIELLSDALSDYSGKLMKLCDDYWSLRRRRGYLLLGGLVLLVYGTLLVVAAELASRAIAVEKGIGMGVGVAGVLMIISGVEASPRLVRLRRNAETHAEQLARVVRLASQADERVIGVSSFGLKLVLDLRLAEAEATLRQSEAVTRRRLPTYTDSHEPDK